MRGELVQLGNIEVDPRGRRYTAEEKEAAYLLWRTAAGRSCRKVALRLNIEERTVRNWRDAGNWVARADQEDHDDFASSRLGVAALVINELVPSIETAVKIRDDKTNNARDRLAAAQWLAGLAGVSPVSKVEQAVIQAPRQTEVIDVQSLTGKSADELMRLEQEARAKKRG